MSNIPAELRYASTHEWVRPEGNGVFTVGITEHAQELLGDMVFLDLPDEGDAIATGDDVAVAESVKAASDIYSPLTGEVVEINESLLDSPETVNASPYELGWFFKIKMKNEAELDDLMNSETYSEYCDSE